MSCDGVERLAPDSKTGGVTPCQFDSTLGIPIFRDLRIWMLSKDLRGYLIC